MKIRHSVEINCPPEVIWTYLDDSEKIKQWMKGVVEDVPTSEGPTGVGSTFRMSIKEGRKVHDFDGEILAYDVNRHMVVRLTGGCLKEDMSMIVDYRLTQTGPGRTRLDYEGGGELTGLWRLAAPIMAVFCKLQIKSFFRTLKSLAESEGSVVPA